MDTSGIRHNIRRPKKFYKGKKKKQVNSIISIK